MKVKYNTFSLSEIGTSVFKRYFLSDGVRQIENKSWEDANLKATNLSTSEGLSYLVRNKKVYTDLYFRNMKMNINATPFFTLFPRGFRYPQIAEYMTFVNTLYYYIHIIFIIPILICLYSVYKKKDINYYFVLLTFTIVLLYYIFLTIPISLWEGDRLVLPSLPLWVFLYTLIFQWFGNLFSFKTKKII